MSDLYFPIAGVAEPAPPRLPCGLGVGIPWQDRGITGDHAAHLGATWYFDWGKADSKDHPLKWPAFWNPHQTRYLWGLVRQWAAGGKIPLAYNEPDYNDISPVDAAAAMREWNAPFIGFGCIVRTEGLAWMDRYQDAGGPRPLAWHIHIYPFDQFAPRQRAHVTDAWKDLHEWAQEWNQRRGGGLPLIVTETNAVGTRSVRDQIAVLHEIRYALDRGELRAAAWYDIRGLGWDADQDRAMWLIGEDGEPTDLGREFQRAAASVNRGARFTAAAALPPSGFDTRASANS